MIGPFVNTAAIILGGLGGASLGERLPENFRERMPLIFGCCALGLGIALDLRI